MNARATKTKYFIIGMNKTGTTCIKYAIASALNLPFKIKTGLYLNKYQNLIDILLKDKNNSSIIQELCDTIDNSSPSIFKDRPWNCNFHEELYKKYPDSKFILTLRNPQEWWESVEHWINIKHPEKTSREELIRLYETHLGTTFSKDNFIEAYIKYNNNIIDYFKTSSNLYLINMPEDFNWQKIKEIVQLDTYTIRKNIKLFIQNKKSRSLNRISRTKEFENEDLEKWEFPKINVSRTN